MITSQYQAQVKDVVSAMVETAEQRIAVVGAAAYLPVLAQNARRCATEAVGDQAVYYWTQVVQAYEALGDKYGVEVF
jgi:hypothetical protein